MHGLSLDDLKRDLKTLIVERLDLPIQPAEIRDDAPLFGSPSVASVTGGLALDSVEALDLVGGIETKWGLTFDDPRVAGDFYSVDTLALLIQRSLARRRAVRDTASATAGG